MTKGALDFLCDWCFTRGTILDTENIRTGSGIKVRCRDKDACRDRVESALAARGAAW